MACAMHKEQRLWPQHNLLNRMIVKLPAGSGSSSRHKFELSAKCSLVPTENVLQLACSVFPEIEAASVSLFGEDSIFVSSAVGSKAQAGTVFPWMAAKCGHVLVPEHAEVLVVEDIRQDAR